MILTLTVDGLRIDTVKHVEKDFWPGYNDAAGVYCVGEVFSGDPAYTCPYQNYLDGVLNYPMYASRFVLDAGLILTRADTISFSTRLNPPAAASATSTT
jgi:glycosidase